MFENVVNIVATKVKQVEVLSSRIVIQLFLGCMLEITAIETVEKSRRKMPDK